MTDLEAIPGESAVAIDALPCEADAPACIAIIEDVHAENVAAVMAQGDLPRAGTLRGWGSQYAARPRSGPVEA